MPLQSAAIPVRIGPSGQPEVLLVRTRRSGLWSIPKGGVPQGMGYAESAAKEAWEEGGVVGTPGAYAAGRYVTMKGNQPIQVLVYWLEVSAETADWPEREMRERAWFPAGYAANLVHEPMLAQLLQNLARPVAQAAE